MYQVWQEWLDNRRWAQRGMAFGLLAAGIAALCILGSVVAFAATAPTAPTTTAPAATSPAKPATVPAQAPGTPASPAKPGSPNAPAPAAPTPADQINVTDGWTRATPNGATTAAIYLNVVNSGNAADQITGVEANEAAKASLHMTEMTGNTAQMKDAGNMPVPANATVSFAPGGKHIMLEGLKAPLKEGESFLITLSFEKGGRQTTSVKVLAANATGPEKRSGVADKLLNAEVTPLPSAADKDKAPAKKP